MKSKSTHIHIKIHSNTINIQLAISWMIKFRSEVRFIERLVLYLCCLVDLINRLMIVVTCWPGDSCTMNHDL